MTPDNIYRQGAILEHCDDNSRGECFLTGSFWFRTFPLVFSEHRRLVRKPSSDVQVHAVARARRDESPRIAIRCYDFLKEVVQCVGEPAVGG